MYSDSVEADAGVTTVSRNSESSIMIVFLLLLS